jgi:hypothetical protein
MGNTRWIAALVVLAVSGTARATDPAPVEVSVAAADKRIRVQIAEGRGLPCDVSGNRMLFDGWMSKGETFTSSIGGDCVCVRHTYDGFPTVDWSLPGLVCRPRICRGRICRPAPDPTIRLALDAHAKRS